ncbi:MAG: DUF4129 domain-containing protein [Gammaproteobacteria bacterium]
MDLERITIALRPRTDFEAVDLGLRLAQSHYATALVLWFCASAPWMLAIAAFGIAQNRTWLALLAFWWIKPAFERPVLHLFSRVVFGDQPKRSEYAGIVLREPFRSGIVSALTWRRFELSRSFNLPVTQLERLKGHARRVRSRILQMGTSGTSAALSMLTLGLVALAFTTLLGLMVSVSAQQIMVFDPTAVRDFIIALSDRMLVGGLKWDVLILASYWLCEGLLAPFYVAAGFCLYLNRRTHLEAWDVELQFRRMVRRRNVVAGILMPLLLCLWVVPTVPSHADSVELEREQSRERIEEVLAQDNFGRTQERTRWVPKKKGDEENDESDLPIFEFGGALSQWFGTFSEIVLWVALAALLITAIRLRDRWLPWLQGAGGNPVKRANQQGGLLLSEDELPADIPSAVRELWARKKHRDALSLLYRGALTVLNDRHGLHISDSHTEGDCERRVLDKLDATSGRYFARIANSWQKLAYGHLSPSTDSVDELCTLWHLIEGPIDE